MGLENCLFDVHFHVDAFVGEQTPLRRQLQPDNDGERVHRIAVLGLLHRRGTLKQ